MVLAGCDSRTRGSSIYNKRRNRSSLLRYESSRDLFEVDKALMYAWYRYVNIPAEVTLTIGI